MPSCSLQLLQQIEHDGLHRHVERRGRLVEDDAVGLERDGARDADARLLPARELVRKAVEQLDAAARPAAPAPRSARARRSRPRHVAEAQDRIGDGARRREARVEAVGRVLEHHLDALAQRQRGEAAWPGWRRCPGRRTRMRPSVVSIRRMTMVEVRRLAAAGLADQADALAACDGEADAVDGAERAAARRRGALPPKQLAEQRDVARGPCADTP